MKTTAKPQSDLDFEGEVVVKKRTNRYSTPFKAEADKATKLTKTYLTPGESETFEGNYRLACLGRKMSRSQFIKERILIKENEEQQFGSGEEATVEQRQEIRKSSKEEKKLLSIAQLNRLEELTKNLNRIGVNYNQSTRRLNQFDLPPDIFGEAVVNKELEKQIIQLVEQLENLYREIEQRFSEKEK